MGLHVRQELGQEATVYPFPSNVVKRGKAEELRKLVHVYPSSQDEQYGWQAKQLPLCR